jgi:hypothetical protein
MHACTAGGGRACMRGARGARLGEPGWWHGARSAPPRTHHAGVGRPEERHPPAQLLLGVCGLDPDLEEVDNELAGVGGVQLKAPCGGERGAGGCGRVDAHACGLARTLRI